jgi:hypothetical protein
MASKRYHSASSPNETLKKQKPSSSNRQRVLLLCHGKTDRLVKPDEYVDSEYDVKTLNDNNETDGYRKNKPEPDYIGDMTHGFSGVIEEGETFDIIESKGCPCSVYFKRTDEDLAKVAKRMSEITRDTPVSSLMSRYHLLDYTRLLKVLGNLQAYLKKTGTIILDTYFAILYDDKDDRYTAIRSYREFLLQKVCKELQMDFTVSKNQDKNDKEIVILRNIQTGSRGGKYIAKYVGGTIHKTYLKTTP